MGHSKDGPPQLGGSARLDDARVCSHAAPTLACDEEHRVGRPQDEERLAHQRYFFFLDALSSEPASCGGVQGHAHHQGEGKGKRHGSVGSKQARATRERGGGGGGRSSSPSRQAIRRLVCRWPWPPPAWRPPSSYRPWTTSQRAGVSPSAAPSAPRHRRRRSARAWPAPPCRGGAARAPSSRCTQRRRRAPARARRAAMRGEGTPGWVWAMAQRRACANRGRRWQ